MKKRNKLILKQAIKYISLLTIFLVGITIYRLMWSIPDNAFYWFAGILGATLLILFVFDAITIKDIIPILKN